MKIITVRLYSMNNSTLQIRRGDKGNEKKSYMHFYAFLFVSLWVQYKKRWERYNGVTKENQKGNGTNCKSQRRFGK